MYRTDLRRHYVVFVGTLGALQAPDPQPFLVPLPRVENPVNVSPHGQQLTVDVRVQFI